MVSLQNQIFSWEISNLHNQPFLQKVLSDFSFIDFIKESIARYHTIIYIFAPCRLFVLESCHIQLSHNCWISVWLLNYQQFQELPWWSKAKLQILFKLANIQQNTEVDNMLTVWRHFRLVIQNPKFILILNIWTTKLIYQDVI